MKTEKNILIAFLLNLSFSVFELFGGIFTRSIAILSDSIHDLGDAFSIGISYFLEKKSKKKPNSKYTYGYLRYSVMGSMLTTMILLFGSAFVIFESVLRLFHPVAVHYDGMILMAVFGVIINLCATYFTREGDSLNQKAVNLHMLEDVLGWVVVLVGSLLMKATQITRIDSVLSILVALYILYHAFQNMKEVLYLFLERTPDGIDLPKIKGHLLKIEGVLDVHHIHVRSIDGFHHYATLHVVVDEYSKTVKDAIKKELEEEGISHSTVELELKDEACESKNCKVAPTKEVEHHHHHK